ncbi:MAG: hypothetical protein JW781_05865 [Deltaproteobacteria bacterium]|nr:hypothetical protein [Candidatus Anaeroferrophillacea bacterium]
MIRTANRNPVILFRRQHGGKWPSPGSRSVAAPDADNGLGTVEIDLTASCSEAERDFLRIGGKLQDVYRQAMELQARVTAAVGHIGGSGNGDIPVPARLGAVAEGAAAELAAIEKEVQEKSGHMHTIRVDEVRTISH